MDNRTRNLLTSIGLLIPLLGLVLFFMFSILPQKGEVERLESQVSQNKELIAVLEEKQTSTQEEVYDTNALQKMVPVKPLVDQFVLDLNQAELVSKSNIKQLDFVDEVLNPEQYAEEASEEETVESGENNAPEEVSEDEAESAESQSADALPGLPDGIQAVNVSMAMVSDNYSSLRTFLESIEGLPRMAVISGLSFTGETDAVLLDEAEKNELTYTADVATFYIPTLTDLAEQTPSLDYPEPADKDNPLYEKIDKEEASE
ncbi:hypothetical protein [Anaerobacillus sp. 1_MG-2023]|uniref:hypothetical protein n=1 Tax=Bacillales TaxID=1385 RepID=UPI0026E1CC0F|nr:hypothetical protein [Anaerobacillus sp. 1_MG-2023]MDO6656021.1 hypothetical protein [Anaerobacillus sp. 1_MG-2023]